MLPPGEGPAVWASSDNRIVVQKHNMLAIDVRQVFLETVKRIKEVRMLTILFGLVGMFLKVNRGDQIQKNQTDVFADPDTAWPQASTWREHLYPRRELLEKLKTAKDGIRKIGG